MFGLLRCYFIFNYSHWCIGIPFRFPENYHHHWPGSLIKSHCHSHGLLQPKWSAAKLNINQQGCCCTKYPTTRKRCVWHCRNWTTVWKIAYSANRLKAKKRKLRKFESGIRPSQCESDMHLLHLGSSQRKADIMNVLGLRNVLETSI